MRALPFFILYLLVVPLRADAYLDPGSGSLVFQVMIAFFVGIAFALKQHWMRFTSFFKKGKGSFGKLRMTSMTPEAEETGSRTLHRPVQGGMTEMNGGTTRSASEMTDVEGGTSDTKEPKTDA